MDRAGLEGEGLDAGDTDGATLEENNPTGGAALQDDPEGPWCWWSSSRGLLGPLVMEDLYRGGRLIEGERQSTSLIYIKQKDNRCNLLL